MADKITPAEKAQDPADAKPGTAEAPAIVPQTADVIAIKSLALAQDAALARDLKMDETVPGGRYLRSDGTAVNANGEVIKE